LPEIQKLARDAGIEIPLLTTSFLSADEPFIAETLHTAGRLGIREIKLGYWEYEGGGLQRAIDAAKRSLDGLSKLAAAAGVRINVHNHSGDFVQCSPLVVAELLKDRDPTGVGCYFDPAHYTIEGGLSGWKLALELLVPRISLLAVKDNKWVDVPGISMPSQERRWVPVGSGNVRWKEVAKAVKQSGYDGWTSVHCEYQGRWTWKQLDAAGVLEQGVTDRDAFEKAWVES
jgi:sugar phosphate isomerase/epimerase